MSKLAMILGVLLLVIAGFNYSQYTNTPKLSMTTDNSLRGFSFTDNTQLRQKLSTQAQWFAIFGIACLMTGAIVLAIENAGTKASDKPTKCA